MRAPGRIVVALLILAIIAALGFVTGNRLRENPIALPTLPSAADTPNLRTYAVSPPSIGALPSVIDLRIPSGTFLPYIEIPPAKAALFRPGQRAIIRDHNGAALDFVAEVLAISPPRSAGAPAGLTIAIRGAVPDSLRRAAIASVEVARETSIARLPKSAIVTGAEDNIARAWEIERKPDGRTVAYLRGLTLLGTGDDYVAVLPPVGSSNVYVLEPDARLRDGAAINTVETLYAGPEFTEADVIALRLAPLLANQELARRLARPPGTLPGAGCPVPATLSFIEQIRRLAPTLPDRNLPQSRPAP